MEKHQPQSRNGNKLPGLHQMKGVYIMGERALKNRIKQLIELEKQQKAIQEQADKLKAEIKADMEAKGQEEMKVGDYLVRFKTILSTKFDTKAFKEEHKKLFEMYSKPAASKRFTIA